MEKIFGNKIGNTTEQIAKESMMENYPNESIMRVHSFVNSNFSDPQNVPSGILSIHPKDAKIHPDSITKDLFDVMVITQIDNSENKLDDRYFKDKKKKLNESIPQFSKNPARLYDELHDSDGWSAEIGQNGFSGVFKQTSHDTHDTSYFIVSKTNVGSVYKDFKKNHARKLTFGDILDDHSYNTAKYIAVRNAERIAYSTARALGVGISSITDSNAHKKSEYIAKPFKAVQVNGCCVSFSSFEPVSFDGEQCVGLFNSLAPTNRVSNEHFVNAGPQNGITVFNMHSDAVGRAIPLTTKTTNQNALHRKALDCLVCEGNQKILSTMPVQSKVDNDFLKEMSKMGWKQEGIDNRKTLFPVLVKISNPKINK